MVYVSPDPRSYGPEDTQTLSSPSKASQAEARAAYIARVVAEAPPLTDAQIDHIAVLLRPRAQRSNATPAVSVSDWQSWEIRRHLDSENPGRHGSFNSKDAA